MRPRAGSPSSATTLPVAWLHRSERYGEKLATPDTSVGDLIGDVDPIKVAEGRTLGDPETVHYGLVPRTNRGIFAVNELPDLAERIQVALLNVLEERDIQVRGYALRLPLDLLLVASANPEDYTNRGRIITPLKDRFGAEIRTHYPLELDRRGRRWSGRRPTLVADVPEHLLEVVARFTRARPRVAGGRPALRRLGPVRDRGGRDRRPRPRCAASALHRRGAGRSPGSATCRRSSPTLRGKVEFEVGEEGRELEVLAHLLRRATAETFRARLGRRWTCPALHRARSTRARPSRPATWCRPPSCSRQVGTVPGLAKVLDRLGVRRRRRAPAEQAAAAVEFALEGLYLTRRLPRTTDGRPHRLRRPELSRWPAAGGYRYGALARRPRPARAAVRRRARRSTRSATTCWPAASPARGAARPAAPRHRRPARPRRAAPRGPRGCAARRATAGDLDGTLDQVRALLDQAARPRSGERCSPTRRRRRPVRARRELDALPDDTAARGPGARRLRLALARGPADVRADPGPAAPRGARQRSSAA